MADEHDPSNDNEIKQRLSDPEHGTWSLDGETGVFTPNASFFSAVSPVQLATFFRENGGEHYRLNLP